MRVEDGVGWVKSRSLEWRDNVDRMGHDRNAEWSENQRPSDCSPERCFESWA